MDTSARPLLRWLLYGAATVVIAMALAVGALRLLLPMVPNYQDDIRAWAGEATGYDMRFEGISASWPLSGPALTFYEVTLARPGEADALIGARELSAGLSLWQLVRHGRLAVGRVAVQGTRFSVERSVQGEWRVQGRRPEDLLPKARREAPEIDLELSDVVVVYRDLARDPQTLTFGLRHLHAALTPGDLKAESLLDLPERFGGRIEAQVQAPWPLPSPLALPPVLEVQLRLRAVNLARLASFALGAEAPVQSAVGDVNAGLALRDGALATLRGDLRLRDVVAGATVYERLTGRLEWSRDASGWQAEVADLRLRRNGRDSPRAAASVRHTAGDARSAQRWSVSAPFLRLDDLFPLAQAVLAGTELEARLPRTLGGDLSDLQAEFADQAREPGRYSLRVGFERLGIAAATGESAVAGLSGSIAADGDGGRLQLASRDVAVQLDQWFRDTLRAQSVDGLLIWRTSPDRMRFVSDDIHVRTEAIDIRSRLELDVPVGDQSPVVNIKANASASQAREVLRYLPLRRFPPKVVDWLERAVVAGEVPAATIEFRGPLRQFPFEQGEGVFRAALDLRQATLDYANGWPRVESLDGEVVFDGVGMSATAAQARLGGLELRDYQVRIPDLRLGLLSISGRQRLDLEQILGFVRRAPLGPRVAEGLARTSGAGPVDTALRLSLPVTEPAQYRLQALFDARGCRLGWRQLPVDLRELRGRVLLQNTRFSGDALRAVMMGEPVQIALQADAAADDGAVTHVARLSGATPVGRLTSTFKLPLRRYFGGQLAWDATVTLLPPADRRASPLLTVGLRSDLQGVTSELPAPLAKAATDAWPMEMDLAFPAGNFIDVTGRLSPPFAWALRLAGSGGGWKVERGMLRAGPGEARLPSRRGVEVVGRVAELRLADWLDVGEDEAGSAGSGAGGLREIYREVDLQIDRLAVVGQLFRDTRARVVRTADAWDIQVSGPAAEGAVSVPFDLETRPLALVMKRLWLQEAEAAGAGEASRTDPRSVPAVSLKADDAAFGDWRVGRLELAADKAPDGLVARRISARSPSFVIDGNAAWRVEGGDVSRQSTRLEATLSSTNVGDTLRQLGYGPVMTGEKARVSATLTWPDGPRANFLAESTGRIGVAIEDGQVLEVEPGGSGRLLGLISVTALPRRLALDFSDVFSKGLAFDAVKGDFRIGSGSAFTCNLGLTGPAADIGIVGRAGFSARDYDQFAVVRPQVSSVLTVGGVVLGGPVGGATMLLISQLFRKPLSTLGESYYRVTGSWDQPGVDRVQRADLDTSAFKDCEKEVAEALQRLQLPSTEPPPATGPGAPR